MGDLGSRASTGKLPTRHPLVTDGACRTIMIADRVRGNDRAMSRRGLDVVMSSCRDEAQALLSDRWLGAGDE